MVKKGQTSTEIIDELTNVYGDSAPSHSTIKKWAAEFKRGRLSLDDDPREGRPSLVISEENVRAVETRIMADRRSTVRQIAEDLGISAGSVVTIIHERLGMNKVCSKWVPRLLTTVMRADRRACSNELLAMVEAEPDFFDRVVTGDESWVHHYDPETQIEAKEWRHPGSPRPCRPRAKSSAGKIMLTVFWDVHGVLLVDFLAHKQTITGAYYANLLKKLRDAVKQKRRGKLRRGVLLLHDNAPVHKSHVAQGAVRECGFRELNHPPYSPDLAPSDYWLFPGLKKHLRGHRFHDDKEVKTAVMQWFEGLEEEFFSKGIRMLQDRWTLAKTRKGSYVEY